MTKKEQEIHDAVLNNENLIHSIVNRFRNYISKEDLYQVGAMGIINAYNNFDSSKGVKFSTYAYFYILGEIKKYVREDKGIKISRDIANLGSKIERVKEILTQKYNRVPNVKELSMYLEIEEKKIVEALETKNYIRSLDEVINDDGKDLTLSDVIYVEERYDKLDFINLNDGIKALGEKEKSIIRNRYFEDRTQSETANILGISQVQVSRVEQKALSELKNYYK